MFYRDLDIPAIIEIGSSISKDIDLILKKHHIYYKEKILFTQKILLDKYEDFIEISNYSKIILVEGGTVEELGRIELEKLSEDMLLVAFGGGSVIDLVKMYASKNNVAYITLPSTLSNDAIYSPIARLKEGEKKKSFGVHAPIGIIVDVDIIKQSPDILLLAGVGDLISNLSAVQDCKLAIKNNNERIDSFALTLAKISANGLFPYTYSDIRSVEFIEQLANGLIVSGLSMMMDKTSRPASGAEHLISHAIDEYFPEKSTYHGIQVAWAQLILEKVFRKNNNYGRLCEFYNNIGLNTVICQYIQFSEGDFINLIPKARAMRNRFTILNFI